LYETSI